MVVDASGAVVAQNGSEHRTVSRVVAILELVAAAPSGVSLGALATELAAPKSSIHGLAKGLVATGYLVEAGGRYVLGPAISELYPRERPTLLDTVKPAMERIRAEFNETVALCLLVGNSVVYNYLIESTHPIRYSQPLRTRRPLYPTSSGKCFLAFAPQTKRNAYLREHFPDRPDIQEELDLVARIGIAYNRGETVPDVTAAASPILVAGRCVACISVAGPSERMNEKLEAIGALLSTTAGALSKKLAP